MLPTFFSSETTPVTPLALVRRRLLLHALDGGVPAVGDQLGDAVQISPPAMVCKPLASPRTKPSE